MVRVRSSINQYSRCLIKYIKKALRITVASAASSPQTCIYIYQLHFTYSTYFVIVLEGTFTYSCYHNLQEFLIRFQIDPAWTLSTFLMGVDSVWRSRGFEKSNSLIGFSCQRCIIGDCLQRLCTRSSMTLYLPSVIFCLKLFKAI